MADITPQQRRLNLHRLLLSGKKVVASQLAKLWNCDERSIRRTLGKMRDQEGLPVEYDPIDGTWRYTKAVAEVPALLVSNEDRRALLFSMQAAAQFEGTPVRGQISRMYNALLATLPPEHATKFERMMKSVRFIGPLTKAIKKDVWDVLLLCLEAQETMQITYTDSYYGSTTQREVDAYGLTLRDRRWILVAFCHRLKNVRAFSLHRISQAEGTDKQFKVPTGFMDEYLADAFEGMQSTGEKSTVVLRIARDAPSYLQEQQWSESESRTLDKQGNTIVEFQTAALFAVERQVRADEGWVAVLKPAESRERLREAGQAIAAAHK